MARRQSTREAKKLKDKWKAKQWYSIVAPDLFNRAKIGETLADDPSKLMGRTIEVTLQDLTGDFRMMHVKLKFKIIDHTTSEAFTKYLGHDLTSDFIRRQTRRKRTKMEGVFDIQTKDGYKIRLKPMAFSDKRIQSTVQYHIRKKMQKVLDDLAEKHTFSELASLALTSDRDRSLVSIMQRECKKIYPLRRVDLRRLDVLSHPEGVDDAPIDSMAPVPDEEDEGDKELEETFSEVGSKEDEKVSPHEKVQKTDAEEVSGENKDEK